MSPEDRIVGLEARVARLQRRVALLSVALVMGGLAACIVGMGGDDDDERPAMITTGDGLMRCRGIVIDDAHGRPRILLGAPIPKVADRKRKDDATALVFLGEDGADRLTLGFTPDPQMQGKVVKRISPGVGLQINDPAGNERSGYSYLENGRVVLGMDWKDREALTLSVDDAAGFAAVMLAGRTGGHERVGLYADDETALIKTSGTDGPERAILKVTKTNPAELLLIDPARQSITDVLPALREKGQDAQP